jgi:hypothetical protein
MSSRFHNKYHRHNHHTRSEGDPRYPDATHDPIASLDAPFLGPFFLFGTLSANAIGQFTPNTQSGPAGSFLGETLGITVQVPPPGIAIESKGDVQITGALSATGVVTLQDIIFTGNVITTYQNPVTATGEFLQVRVNDTFRAVRLWQYE